MFTRRMLVLASAMGLMVAMPTPGRAQDPARTLRQQQQQQMQRMQEQVQQLNRVMERMSGIQERAQNMERQMVQAMERLQQNRDLAAQNAVQLRNQERLRNMAQSMNDGAREMHRAMEQFRNMLGDPGAPWDDEMEGQMERLRLHWEDMAGQMEEGLQIMDRIRDRIHQTPTSG